MSNAIRINEHLSWADGIYRMLSVSSGRYYFSSDGNTWHDSPEAAKQHAA